MKWFINRKIEQMNVGSWNWKDWNGLDNFIRLLNVSVNIERTTCCMFGWQMEDALGYVDHVTELAVLAEIQSCTCQFKFRSGGKHTGTEWHSCLYMNFPMSCISICKASHATLDLQVSCLLYDVNWWDDNEDRIGKYIEVNGHGIK
jgi:hypothetical protein